jgi:flagellar hook-length control protein FliK
LTRGFTSMPKIADNFFSTNTASLSISSRRSSSNQSNDSGDLFQKILNQSRPKSEEPADAPRKPSHAEKSETRSRRADASDRRKHAADDDNDQVDRAEEAPQSQADSSSADEATDASAAQPATDAAAPATKDPKHTEDSDQSDDAAQLAGAAAAANQQAPQQTAKASPVQQDSLHSAAQPLAEVQAKPPVKPLHPDAAKTLDDAHAGKPNAQESDSADASASTAAGTAGDDQQDPDENAQEPQASDPSLQALAKRASDRPRKVAALGDEQPLAPKSTDHTDAKQPDSSAQPTADAMAVLSAMAQLVDPATDSPEAQQSSSPAKASGVDSEVDRLMQIAQPAANHKADSSVPVKPAATPPAPARPEAEFAETNHDRIVTSLRSQLLPNGGTMHMRLDPPELGVLQVTVRMQDGVMTASFETSSDQATKLLSHSLGQLKTVLESQGVSVEKLHVQQTPKDQQANSNGEDRQHQHAQQDGQSSTRQEQQRREMLRRMWRRLGIGHDPLDMVA